MSLPFLSLEVSWAQATTSGFDAKETGAFFALLISAWSAPENSLPANEKQLARMARCTTTEWARVRPVVMKSWYMAADGRWHNEWLDSKREWVLARSETNRQSANAKWLKYNETSYAVAQRTLSSRSANYNYIDNNNSSSWKKPKMLRWEPLRLSGPDSKWKIRLQAYMPGDEWRSDWGPPPESDAENPFLDESQRREWRISHGYPAAWRTQ